MSIIVTHECLSNIIGLTLDTITLAPPTIKSLFNTGLLVPIKNENPMDFSSRVIKSPDFKRELSVSRGIKEHLLGVEKAKMF